MSEAKRAIVFTCDHCQYENWCEDTLDPTSGSDVRAGHIICACCGEDNFVTMEDQL